MAGRGRLGMSMFPFVFHICFNKLSSSVCPPQGKHILLGTHKTIIQDHIKLLNSTGSQYKLFSEYLRLEDKTKSSYSRPCSKPITAPKPHQACIS